MTQNIKEILDQIRHHEVMIEHHTSLATSLRMQYQSLVGDSSVDWRNSLLKRRPTKSHQRWVEWLSENGPASRKTIADAVGLLTGEIPPYANLLPAKGMFPDDMMLRLSADNPHNHGRPLDVYFLWSQRFDVLPLFGVGPERPLETDGESETLLGVIMPPEPSLDATYQEMSDEVESEPETDALTRYGTLEEWNVAHSDLFDRLAQYGAKPTDEERDLLGKTLPEGVEYGPSIAVAYSEAVKRSRSRPDV